MIKLNEITRSQAVSKTRKQSPKRYAKRIYYGVKDFGKLNVNDLVADDMLVITAPVGDYMCTVAYTGVLDELELILQRQQRPNVNIDTVRSAISNSIDKTDVKVNCTCADFRYRFAYFATKNNYKYGKAETRPSNITNPDDDIGAVCKHLTSLLVSKEWLRKVASIVNKFIKEYPEDVRDVLKSLPDELFINEPGRPSQRTGHNVLMKQEPLKEPSEDELKAKEQELELEPEEEIDSKEDL